MINCVYYKRADLGRKSLSEMFEIANLAEMYDVKVMMRLIVKTIAKVTLNLENVVHVAYTVQKMSVFSFFNTRWESIFDRCCHFLLKTVLTRVLDFSGLNKASEYVETVQMLNERISEMPHAVFVDSLSGVSIRLLPQYDDFIYSCSCTLFVRVRARDHGGLNARLISGYEHVIN